jgi:phage repressor protein C with HTH and peptisase S24 domain
MLIKLHQLLFIEKYNKEIPDIIIKGDELDGCQIIGRVVGSIKKF